MVKRLGGNNVASKRQTTYENQEFDGHGRPPESSGIDFPSEANNIPKSRAVGAVGYETPSPSSSKDKHLQISSNVDAAHLLAPAPELAEVIAAWPRLPDAIRTAITALVKASPR